MSWLTDQLACLPSRLLPQQAASRLVYQLARSRRPWLKQALINGLIRACGVDLSDAAEPDPRVYPDFVSFFTRALRDGARPLAGDEHTLVSPADGTLSAFGSIAGDTLLQAKGRTFTAAELLGGDFALADEFTDGSFATVYLAPRDYHRVHMPLTGTLRSMTHVPGRLFSVQGATARGIDRLYARNERLVCVFDTVHGPLAVVLVGALLVSSISTVWAGEVNPPGARAALWRRTYPAAGEGSVHLARGAELGHFAMGSTVILLLPPGGFAWADGLYGGIRLRCGQALGRWPARNG
ncbi:archaetidylserine decarboxylase [Immundisolibacter sp.]|uniref:archaetidylserine decarboxylase n=1 Tax=Immundisolibacter sp. TaxID=1934948 RepID=UPI0026021CFF|nr:archaetidylserine decarboxylase [Immundisolibacter sp.]MDD3650515.1 archaetidylserine decarboxylase [Immundisolibacter sp.]